MQNKTYRIGELCIRLVSDEPIRDAGFFPLFRTDDAAVPDLTVRVLRQPLPQAQGREILRTNHRRRVLADGLLYDYTCFSDAAKRTHVPYACALRQGDCVALYADYDAEFWDTMLFDAVGFADFCLAHNAAVVHASCIRLDAEAILFAGPKQTGKTTQATLWQAYKNAAVINDDRVLVRGLQDGFYAYGIPFCGSAHVCLNEKQPIRAIVFPKKGEENTVSPLSAIESFKQLIGCVTYTQQDPDAMRAALLLTEQIAANNRCLQLCCLPDASAVTALAGELGIS